MSAARQPLSKERAGVLAVSAELKEYMDDLFENGPTRLEAVRSSGYAKEFVGNLDNDASFWEVDSPWSCSTVRSPERDHTVNKSQANKDTTVGSKKDARNFRHYRSKLTDIWTAAGNNELEEVNLYIECGVDVNMRNSTGANGETALHNAALGGHLEMIELLLQNGNADVNATDDVGNTPLHMAARAGHYDAAMRLLDFSAAALVKNEACHTPWLVAHLNGHLKLRDELPKPKNYSVRTASKAADAGARILGANKAKRQSSVIEGNKYHRANRVKPTGNPRRQS